MPFGASSRARRTSSFQKVLPPSISVSPGSSRAASSAIAASVAAPAGSMTHTARGVSSARTTLAEARACRRTLARELAPRLGIAVVDHTRVAMPHEPAGDIGAHAPEADDADLHGSFPAVT